MPYIAGHSLGLQSPTHDFLDLIQNNRILQKHYNVLSLTGVGQENETLITINTKSKGQTLYNSILSITYISFICNNPCTSGKPHNHWYVPQQQLSHVVLYKYLNKLTCNILPFIPHMPLKAMLCFIFPHMTPMGGLTLNRISDMLKITFKYETPYFGNSWHFSFCKFSCNCGKIGMLLWHV